MEEGRGGKRRIRSNRMVYSRMGIESTGCSTGNGGELFIIAPRVAIYVIVIRHHSCNTTNDLQG